MRCSASSQVKIETSVVINGGGGFMMKDRLINEGVPMTTRRRCHGYTFIYEAILPVSLHRAEKYRKNTSQDFLMLTVTK